jgi:hypothetical protein
MPNGNATKLSWLDKTLINRTASCVFGAAPVTSYEILVGMNNKGSVSAAVLFSGLISVGMAWNGCTTLSSTCFSSICIVLV